MKNREEILEEALLAVGDLRVSGLNISMGVGKTHIALEHIRRQYTLTRRYLVVVPGETISKSWITEIEKWDLGYLKGQIEYTTYRSLNKCSYDYDYIYLDECHSLKLSHDRWLNGYIKQGGRILGLTGTYPVKKSSEKGKMCNRYCPLVYTYTPTEAVDDEILNDYEIIVHELELDIIPTIKKKGGPNGEFVISETKDYKYWTGRIESTDNPEELSMLRIQRMKAMQSYPTKEVYAKNLFDSQTEKCIIFANTQEQAERLCSHSFHANNPKSDENLKLFSSDAINKLSAVEQLNQGVNIPNLKIGIILHSYANNRQASQKIGRMLRLNPKDKAMIHILCYVNTIDKEWVKSALEELDESKIKWIKPLWH